MKVNEQTPRYPESDLFHECAEEIQEEWGMSGLAGDLYEDFARACHNRFLEKIEG